MWLTCENLEMHVVIIGGTRSIGLHVVLQLAASGHIVTVYHRGGNEAAMLPSDIRHVHDARAGIPVLEFSRELLDPRPDLVIHWEEENSEPVLRERIC